MTGGSAEIDATVPATRTFPRWRRSRRAGSTPGPARSTSPGGRPVRGERGQGPVGRDAHDRQRTVDRREVGDVLDEQSAGAQPAGVLEGGQRRRRGQVPPRCRPRSPAPTRSPPGCRSARRCPAAPKPRRAGPPLSTATSAAPARTTASGSAALRMLSSAATGTSVRLRTSASSGTVRQGCSRYSSAPSAVSARRGHRLIHRPAAVGVHPHGRDLRAYGVDPGDVVGQRLPRLGDLHLRGPRPGKAGQHLRHPSAGTAGTVALIGMLVRRAGGVAR